MEEKFLWQEEEVVRGKEEGLKERVGFGGIGTHQIRRGKENSIDDFESVLVVQVRIASV